MRIRVKIARLIIHLANFIRSLSLMIMRPDDIFKFVHDSYSRQNIIKIFSEPASVDSGLDAIEAELLNKIPRDGGPLLLLGIGGGREAIPIARMGFQITGVDYIQEMLDHAKQNLKRHNFDIQCLLQDFSKLNLPENTFEVAWMSTWMYSSVPTRKRRINMLKRVHKALKPDGLFVCQFHLNSEYRPSRIATAIRRIAAWITLGYISYEKGDVLYSNADFFYIFLSADEIKKEFSDGGFEAIYLDEGNNGRSSAILKKVQSD